MKTILVASDLSARSDWAIERAAKLAAYHDGRLIVLHVVDEDLPARVADRMKEDAETSLQEVASRLEPAEFAKVEIKCGFGEHFAAILNAAEDASADLVVIGKHRKDTIRDLFVGSTGERVIRFGTRPVLVVKRRATHAYQRAMAAVDMSPASASALEFAVRLAPAASLHVIHAMHAPFKGFLHGGKSLEQMAKRQQQDLTNMVDTEFNKFMSALSADAGRLRRSIKEGPPAVTILQAIDDERPDLLVLGTHGRAGVGRMFMGSVAETLVSAAPCDVLVVRGA